MVGGARLLANLLNQHLLENSWTKLLELELNGTLKAIVSKPSGHITCHALVIFHTAGHCVPYGMVESEWMVFLRSHVERAALLLLTFMEANVFFAGESSHMIGAAIVGGARLLAKL